MKSIFYMLSMIAIAMTLYIGIKNGHTWLALFAFSPYIMTLYLVKISTHNTAVITAKVLTLFIVSVGLYFLLDTTYMERYLGDKFSFFFIPLWQWTMLLVAGFVVYLSNEKKDS